MKQIKLWRVLAGGLLWLLAVGALTAQIQIGDLCYILNETDKTAEVTRGKDDAGNYIRYSGDIVIPASVTIGTTYTVTTVGDRAFEWCTGLTSIEIPNSVKTVGERAFEWCEGLTSIEIPNSVTTIGESAFDGCLGLTSVTIADRATALYFGDNVFGACPIRTLYLGGDSTMALGHNMVFSLLFYGLTTLETLTIGDSVTRIVGRAFCNCTGLTSVTIADRATTLYFGDNVFGSCPIRTLYLGGHISYSSHYYSYPPFRHLTTLKTVTIGDSVTRIGSGDFLGCTGLRFIEIPNSVAKIYSGAFYGCTGLRSIEMPEVTSIDVDAFLGCTGLTSIEMPKVTSIGEYVFGNCTGLTSIEMPEVTKIGEGAFGNCTGLTSIEMPSVWEIGPKAFEGCGGLQEVVLGKSVAYIGEGAFSNCTNLTSLTSKAVTPAYCKHDNVFDDVTKNQCELIVPKESVAAYEMAPVWKDFTRITGSKDLSDRIYVTTLRLEPDQASLRVGERLRLHAIVTPDSATEQTVTWSSSDKKVATVNNDGYVVALAAGTAVITARTTDGSDLSATCNIKVVAGNTAVEGLDALQAVRVYAEAGRIEVRGLPLGTAVTLSGVDGRLWYQTEAVTGSELSLVAPCGHVYVLRLNHTHSFKVYLP